MKQEKPVLKSYLSLQLYLQDIYNYRKQFETSFSYEVWAQELNFKNRSYLRQVVIGRRSLTLETAELIKTRLNLDNSDKEFFDLLVRHTRAKTAEEQQLLSKEILKVLGSSGTADDVADYHHFLSNPLLPQLQTLLSFQDIQRTPENLARILKKDVVEINQSLTALKKIDMAEETATGNWKALKKSFKIRDNLGDQSLLNYHAESLKEAIRAQTLPPVERRYKSLLLPLSADEFDIFISELDSFTQKMRRRFDVDDLRGRKLFQVNFNLHSISEKVD